ncbi:MAG: DUF1553 domain-containing protein [Pirellulales bacterium]
MRADKRRRVVDEHLQSADYVRHMADTWRAAYLAAANPDDVPFLAPKWEAWFRARFRENTPYDELVRRILTAPLEARPASIEVGRSTGDADALAFFQAGELKPENIAGSASRMFLGVNLDCAQCHNHPFAAWKQEQFWEFASFFAGVTRLRDDNSFMPGPERADVRELKVPGKEQVVQARFIDGVTPAWRSDASPRAVLADWVTSRDNPYFARAAVNRMWAHFLGRGFVEPLDGFGAKDYAPDEVLDLLAREFVQQDFDLTFLVRTITSTQAYQSSSRGTNPKQDDPKLFARFAVRGLTPEQVYAGLLTAVGPSLRSASTSDDTDALRSDVLAKFGGLERLVERQASIVQALTLMNGRLATDAASLENSAPSDGGARRPVRR